MSRPAARHRIGACTNTYRDPSGLPEIADIRDTSSHTPPTWKHTQIQFRGTQAPQPRSDREHLTGRNKYVKLYHFENTADGKIWDGGGGHLPLRKYITISLPPLLSLFFSLSKLSLYLSLSLSLSTSLSLPLPLSLHFSVYLSFFLLHRCSGVAAIPLPRSSSSRRAQTAPAFGRT